MKDIVEIDTGAFTVSAPKSDISRNISKSAHRPDIDGLRALAIIPVLLFHGRLLCPGGFIGVDVFFVISGYLITGIIERELQQGRFSVIAFYQRRIRRIFPALFAMFAISIAIECLALPAGELKDFAKTLVAASSFSSNIMFFRRAGYFALGADLQPLLHTWSLAVEEQFYLFWPLTLTLLTIRALSKWKLPIVVLLLSGTLALSAHWTAGSPNAAFYLLPSRFWELALGALLSLPAVAVTTARIPRMPASLLSVAGMLMVLYAAATFDQITPFPGFAALLPCVGAALIIAAGEGGPSLAGRILAMRPLVWIGLISYSLYLWHWPVLVFGRLLLNHELDALERGSLVALAFVLAWASWRFVETPFRSAHVSRAKSRNWVLAGLGTTILFVILGLAFLARDGFPARGPAVPPWIIQAKEEADALQFSPCLARHATLPPANGCVLGSPGSAGYDAVLWGDSHAAHLAPAIDEIGRRRGIRFRQLTKPGCAPVPGVKLLPRDQFLLECPAFNDAALQAVLTDEQVRLVVLAARWDVLVSGSVLLTADGKRPSIDDSRRLFEASLRKTLSSLIESGRRVLLLGQVPLPPTDFIGCFERARFRGLNEDVCGPNHVAAIARTEDDVNRILQKAASGLGGNIRIVHPYESLCRNKGCSVREGDRLLYMDDTHLSPYGARSLAGALDNW